MKTFPDAVYVGKRKRQSFANWFLFLDGERTNLVPLRTLWNGKLFRDLNSVWKRHRQDVEYLVELGFPEIRSILTRSGKKLTHTFVPEKFRQTKHNVKCLIAYAFSVCCGNLGVLYESDRENGNSKYLVSLRHTTLQKLKMQLRVINFSSRVQLGKLLPKQRALWATYLTRALDSSIQGNKSTTAQ